MLEFIFKPKSDITYKDIVNMDEEYYKFSANFKKLCDRLNPSGTISWDYGKIKVSLEDIQQAINNNVNPINEIYETIDGTGIERTKEWHIARVLYFVLNPDKIDAIKIGEVYNHEDTKTHLVVGDGHHRYLALQYLKPKNIDILFMGNYQKIRACINK
jgi:hypothetical protein